MKDDNSYCPNVECGFFQNYLFPYDHPSPLYSNHVGNVVGDKLALETWIALELEFNRYVITAVIMAILI